MTVLRHAAVRAFVGKCPLYPNLTPPKVGSFYQLMAINKMQICVEAFGWLMRHMYTSDAFSAEDILQLLKDSEYAKTAWQDTFHYLLSLENEISDAKKELINRLLRESI